jgi:hypothetical protein
MTEEQNKVPIGVEQVCAAILSTVGEIVIPLENLLKDYSGKTIAVNQNEDTKELTFNLVDIVDVETEIE